MTAMPPNATPVDCLGLRCPEPVLATARAARALGATGGLLEIRADDAAFPLDLRSWCRSTHAEVVSLEEGVGSFRAVVRVPPRSSPGVASRADGAFAAKTAAPSANAAPLVSRSSVVDATLVDYRGLRCPEPIVEIAKAARTAKGPLEVIADDPAFPLDLRSWCRSAGATFEPLDAPPGLHRVLVFPRTVAREAFAATMVAALATNDTKLAPAPRREPAPSNDGAVIAAVAEAGPTASFDLSSLGDDELDAELDRIGGLRPGTVVTLLVRRTADQRALRWCTAAGHELRGYGGGGRIDFVVGERAPRATAAIVPAGATPRYDCALLVMHNDLESLLGALLVANSAAAQGMRTMLFFTFWGLNLLRADRPNALAPAPKVSFFQRVFKWLMPKGPRRQGLGQLNFGGMGAAIMSGIMHEKNIRDLPALLASAREQGVDFVACSMSMEVMGIGMRDLEPYENLSLGGVASFVEAGRGAPLTLVF